jgi:cytochrome bd-type quinol oxidase subunit 2
MALNHNVIAAVNFVAILLSIPIIAAGIWLSTQADSSCLNLLQWPIIILGVLVLAAALVGFIGAFWRVPRLLLFYMVAMFLLILALAGLVVFTFVVTNSVGTGHLAPSRLFLEYELDDDSGWLKWRNEGSFQWIRIKECLSSTNV